jgi:hypothetical protein
MKAAFFIIALACLYGSGSAQTKELSRNWALGYQMGKFQEDFSLGVNVTSPYFSKGWLALRLRANVAWHEHINENGNEDWTEYSNVSIGLVSRAADLGGFVRLYGEGGLLLLVPNGSIDSDTVVPTGYGFFGFEFFSHERFNYFLEAGGGGGSVADKLVTNNIYANGFIIQTGFRIHLK